MGAIANGTMTVLQGTGYCCSFTSLCGVMMLALFGYFEGGHTTALGYHCKKSEAPCPQSAIADNQTTAAHNCFTAAMIYALFFALSIVCVKYGNKGESRLKPDM